ncbi:Type 1 glutamine amidotransferase-like domain-containing protein [Sphingobacterium faecale]|uniref:Type 1 glutamine amidotransferase-like domain-containing protein n=1 Tax=Sphingobacterium faecale TaxID=2803775 RepID=A0ABS1R8K7_9SPHI|nr:Type 1 glutamine amidotransferase-like domain-containing protein [Sphingobacterium faecale]MBL1411047.1 Type 1 glutamine amidotransferase-like domain-containing protein [Sphingobacterium faecale]
MMYRYILLLISVVLFTAPAVAQVDDVHSHWTGSWQTIGPPTGTLMIIGGAASSANYDYFMQLVGDPAAPIVFIPTAGDIFDETNTAYQGLVKAGATNITILHTKQRDVADSESFVAPLRSARAVFIGGGFQKRLAEAYLNTLTHQLMFGILAKGGVIAGSSAGASIQGSYLYGGGPEQKIGFGFMKQSIIGQHYIRRNRMGSIAKILNKEVDLLGFGIDEATAAIIKGDVLEVVGEGKIAMYNPLRPGYTTDSPQEYLFSGDRYDVHTREIIHRSDLLSTSVWTEEQRVELIARVNSGPGRDSFAGKVMIYGSHKLTDQDLRFFLEKLNKPAAKIVVLSTGNDTMRTEGLTLVRRLHQLGGQHAVLLHTINSSKANTDDITALLKGADAVWIGDTRSWQLADTYLYTSVHREMLDIVQRGGVIAGNGAGAAMLSTRLFSEPEKYGWHHGFGFVRDAMIVNPHADQKSLAQMKTVLKQNKRLNAIVLNEDSKLLVEAGRLRLLEGKPIFLYNSATNKTKITAGKEILLNGL